MNKKQAQTSILDLFLNQLQDHKQIKDSSAIAAESLYAIWKERENKVSKRIYKKPNTISSADIEDLQKNGFVRCIGDKVEITAKGNNMLKTMILGNDKSSFEDDSLSYHYAQDNINARSRQKKNTQSTWADNLFGQ